MSDAAARIKTLLTERIVVIDGAMGTMLQGYELDEAGFRGKELADHPRDLKGDNDLLNLTRPGIVEEIHGQYLEAGADILETNTFNSTAVAQADYGLQGRAYDLNVAGALVARRAVLAAMGREPGRPRFVAGAMGPTNRTASLSRDVNDPGARAITFDRVTQSSHPIARQQGGYMSNGA